MKYLPLSGSPPEPRNITIVQGDSLNLGEPITGIPEDATLLQVNATFRRADNTVVAAYGVVPLVGDNGQVIAASGAGATYVGPAFTIVDTAANMRAWLSAGTRDVLTYDVAVQVQHNGEAVPRVRTLIKGACEVVADVTTDDTLLTAPLQSIDHIAVTLDAATIADADTTVARATAYHTPGTAAPLVVQPHFSWSSDAPNVSSVAAGTGPTNVITGQAPGAAVISASARGKAGSASLVVTGAFDTLMSALAAAPADPTTGKLVVNRAWKAGRGHTTTAGRKTAWTSAYQKAGLAAADYDTSVGFTDAGPGNLGLLYDPASNRLQVAGTHNLRRTSPDVDYGLGGANGSGTGRTLLTFGRIVAGDKNYDDHWGASGEAVAGAHRLAWTPADAAPSAWRPEHGESYQHALTNNLLPRPTAPGAGVLRMWSTCPADAAYSQLVVAQVGRAGLAAAELASFTYLAPGDRTFTLGVPVKGDGSYTSAADYDLVLEGDGLPTAAQLDLLDAYARSHGGEDLAARPQVIYGGNSLFQLMQEEHGFGDYAADSLDVIGAGWGGVTYQTGTAGSRHGLFPRMPWVENRMRDPRRPQVYVGYEITNDVGKAAQNGTPLTAAQAYANYKAWGDAITALGYLFVPCTPLCSTFFGHVADPSIYLDVRTAMLNDAAHWGGLSMIADVADPAISGGVAYCTDNTKTGDGTHWNPAFQAARAPEIRRAVRAKLAAAGF